MKSLPIAAFFMTMALVMPHSASADIVITKAGNWRITVKARVSVCLSGSCSSTKAMDMSEQYLPEGSIIRVEIQGLGCAVGLAEYCQQVPGKSGRVKFLKCDKAAITEILRECSPYPLRRVTLVRGIEQLAPDGMSFIAAGNTRFTASVQGHSVSVAVTYKVSGELLDAGLASLRTSETAIRPVSVPLDGLVGELFGRLFP